MSLPTTICAHGAARSIQRLPRPMIVKDVRHCRPYLDHRLSTKDWAQIPPQQVHLTELVTTTTVVELDRVLSEDPTLPGDLFPHTVRWCGELFLENGLHRALRAALQQRTALHVRASTYYAADDVHRTQHAATKLA
jgi:Arc/MetJ family transcription regulator